MRRLGVPNSCRRDGLENWDLRISVTQWASISSRFLRATSRTFAGLASRPHHSRPCWCCPPDPRRRSAAATCERPRRSESRPTTGNKKQVFRPFRRPGPSGSNSASTPGRSICRPSMAAVWASAAPSNTVRRHGRVRPSAPSAVRDGPPGTAEFCHSSPQSDNTAVTHHTAASGASSVLKRHRSRREVACARRFSGASEGLPASSLERSPTTGTAFRQRRHPTPAVGALRQMCVAAPRPDEHANHNADGDDDESEAEEAHDK